MTEKTLLIQNDFKEFWSLGSPSEESVSAQYHQHIVIAVWLNPLSQAADTILTAFRKSTKQQ